MKDFSSFFILLILVTILYLYLEGKATEVTYVEAKDGDSYLVRNLPDKLEAANLLADMKDRLTKLVNHVYSNRNNDGYKNKKTEIESLKKNYRPDAISESSPGNKYTSYSINKGKKIVYCLRSKTVENKLVDLKGLNKEHIAAISEKEKFVIYYFKLCYEIEIDYFPLYTVHITQILKFLYLLNICKKIHFNNIKVFLIYNFH